MGSITTLDKDSLDKFEKAGVVYKLTCKVGNSTYGEKTGRLLNTRVEEHENNFQE